MRGRFKHSLESVSEKQTSSRWSLQGFTRTNTVANHVLFTFPRLRTAVRLVLLATLLCVINSCGGPSHDIIGKWRTADANALVWEFFPNGSVVIGKDTGRYSFGDQKRIKIQTSFAKSVYQMEVSGDHMALTSPSGLKLEFTRIR